ncbi:septal ring lytic transglycosylase RlpA family protein [bacterium]|nr:septal ring lytic transglycosylase RlpA family protein [bacterium]MBU1958460.1 septal ring lytic transglycosylase RlpA family protein [bacterium]
MLKLFLLLLLTATLFSNSREESIIEASLFPYTVKNITYYPHKVALGERKDILASWYGEYFHGRLTALGEVYDMNGYTAAHKTYPLGTVLNVTNPENGKSLEVRINDRGPFWGDRELDLSKGAASYLETKNKGVAEVSIEVISVPESGRSDFPVLEIEPKVAFLPAVSRDKIVIHNYAFIAPDETNVPVEFGRFKELPEAQEYKVELKEHLAFSYILKYEKFYKIKSFLPADDKKARAVLDKLKKLELIHEYELFWSYR